MFCLSKNNLFYEKQKMIRLLLVMLIHIVKIMLVHYKRQNIVKVHENLLRNMSMQLMTMLLFLLDLVNEYLFVRLNIK
jgi:hypothetical protein